METNNIWLHSARDRRALMKEYKLKKITGETELVDEIYDLFVFFPLADLSSFTSPTPCKCKLEEKNLPHNSNVLKSII